MCVLEFANMGTALSFDSTNLDSNETRPGAFEQVSLHVRANISLSFLLVDRCHMKASCFLCAACKIYMGQNSPFFENLEEQHIC